MSPECYCWRILCLGLVWSVVVGETVPQYGLGPSSGNPFEFEEQLSSNTNFESFICSDSSLEIFCGLFRINNYIHVQCWTFEAKLYFEVNTEIIYYADYAAVYDNAKKTIIYRSLSSGVSMIIGYSLISQTNLFAINAVGMGPWLANDYLGLFYMSSSYGTEGEKVMQAFNSTSGAAMPTTSTPALFHYGERFSCLLLERGNKIACGPIEVAGEYDPCIDGDGVYPVKNLFILNASTLELDCSIRRYISSMFSNGKFLYIYDSSDSCAHVGRDMVGYDAKCEALWRSPVDISYIKTFSYDLNLNFLYLYNGSELYQVTENLSEIKSVKIFTPYLPEAWENPPGLDYLPFDDFVGIDSASDIYVWGHNAQTVELRKYNFNLKEVKNARYSSTLTYGSELDYDDPKCLSLTNNGFMYLASFDNVSPKIVTYFVTDSGSWTWVDSLSVALLVISLVVAIALSIKHCVLGADPVGWNKRKCCDAFCIILLTIGLLLVNIFTCLNQIGLMAQIESETVMFDVNLEKFYEESMIPCSNASTISSAVGLCTCDDASNEYRSSSCVSSSCLNSVGISCDLYLQETCDCSNSMYQWQCACDYTVDNNCAANATSIAKINPDAESRWKYCQTHFARPTNLLKVNFYLLLVSAGVIALLQLLNIIRKLDSTFLEVLVTVASLIFATTQFLVLFIGFSYVASSDDCIENVLAELPGCVLNSQATNYIAMQFDAVISLQNAYRNLFITPFMFLLSVIADVWALFYIIRNLIKKRRYKEI